MPCPISCRRSSMETPPSSVTFEPRDRRHDDARIGAAATPQPIDEAIVRAHGLRRHRAGAPAEQLGAALQAFGQMARGERLPEIGSVAVSLASRRATGSCRARRRARRRRFPWRSRPDARRARACSRASARRCAPAARGRGNARIPCRRELVRRIRRETGHAARSGHPPRGSLPPCARAVGAEPDAVRVAGRKLASWNTWARGTTSFTGRPRRCAATAASTVCICSEFFWPKSAAGEGRNHLYELRRNA